MRKKIKVGVFGAMRGMALIRVLANHPDAELTAICDKQAYLNGRCQKLADETGAKITFHTDFEEFFNTDMDAAVLANYADEHAPFAVRLLKSGRHVVSELLPCETLAQAVELVEAVEDSGKVYAYAENCCYYNGVREMKQRFRNGEIGELTHAEGEYIHDCESVWPRITYGERNHWRNRMYSTFYCTHSLGPIVYVTGCRPARVVGFENRQSAALMDLGYAGAVSGFLVMQTDNGATVKNLNGHLKREPAAHWFSVYGAKGVLETDRWDTDANNLNIYREGRDEKYVNIRPEPAYKDGFAEKYGHGGADFYSMHYFLEKIAGNPDGAESIDIYTALDMFLPGLLGYRSILNGNVPIDIPNFRNKDERYKYKNDRACVNPAVAGEQAIPVYSRGTAHISDAVYINVQTMWEKIKAGGQK